MGVSGAEFAQDPSGITFTVNSADVFDSYAMDIGPTAINVNDITFSEGLNRIEFSAKSTEGEDLTLGEDVWAGQHDLVVYLVSETDPFLLESEIQIILSDNLEVTESQTVLNGEAVFSNLPGRAILIEALGPNDEFGSNAVIGGFSSSVEVEMGGDPFANPSTIDNNDFSQGVSGWDTAPEDEGSVTIVDHEQFPGPPNSLLSHRRLNGFWDYFDTSIENEDLCLDTAGIYDDERQVSRALETSGSSLVHIRYRFQTSEVPGGYFGTQFNDYFRISLRSQSQKSTASETATMNGLGLDAFDYESGATAWRDVWLALDETGDTVAVDIAVANVADSFLDSEVCVDFVEEWECQNEYVQAVFEVGFFNAWEAGITLASEAASTAEATGLSGAGDGPQDAFRHCYWNCRMAQELSIETAETVGTLHETCAIDDIPERIQMDLHNNAVGRSKATSSEVDCEQACLDALENYELVDSLDI